MVQKSLKNQKKHRRESGFALVVTISLMVLLSLLAVGLLSLSTITLRSSGQQDAMARARSNAKMSLILAIGELQKHAGTDKAITAPIELVQENPDQPRLTGVWDSWDPLESGGGANYDSAKTERFRRWLVSGPDLAALTDPNYNGSGETIELVGAESMGVSNPRQQDRIVAGRVPVSTDGTPSGAFAWHISDESQKARINAYRNPATSDYPWRKVSLLGGHRPGSSNVAGVDGSDLAFLPDDASVADYQSAMEVAGKLTGFDQFELLQDDASIEPFRHDVTPYSFGLLTNARSGGLKQDLTSMFESPTLPAEYNNKRLYESTHGLTGISDPYWTRLKGYYDISQDSSMTANEPVYAASPRERVLLTDDRDVPRQFHAAPVIARVEMIFSLVARDSHAGWKGARPDLPIMVHLLYAPVVTLHNPYNVSIRFDQLDLDINGIPIAFNFYINGRPQNTRTVPYNQMYVNLQDRAKKSFNISISDWQSFNSNSASPVVMKPGQTLVCGPYIDGDTSFANPNGTAAQIFFDYRNNLTGDANNRAKCRPGFLGKQVAFDIDWLTPDNAPDSTDGNRGVLMVKPTDRIYVEYQMKPNEFGGRVTDSMTVDATLKVGRRELEIGGLKFDYDDRSIRRLYPTVYRYPDARSRPNELRVDSLHEPNPVPLKNQARVKAFALVSARARTSGGGVYDGVSRDPIPRGQNLLQDGILAGVPMLHHNPARTPTVVDLGRDEPGRYSHELTIQPLTGAVDDLYDIDATNRGYLLTGNTVMNGIKSGSYLELPTSPMQTIADFRRSNALTSAMLPNFVQPVANSYSSPLISTEEVIDGDVVDYALLDHSVLANHAFYDNFYFSTFATYERTQGPANVFSAFMNGSQPLASQAFEPYLPEGMTEESAASELFTGGRPKDDTYQKAAAYQMVRTPFNVNSVSVEAWKAVLSSLDDSTIQHLWATSGAREEVPSELTPLMPMSLVNGGAVGRFDLAAGVQKIDNELTNDFNGFQELEPSVIERLAIEIVEEVRTRGPFLSLSEFVNRRVGPTSEETLVGALQAAIDRSGINDNFLAGSVFPIRDEDIADRRFYAYPNPDASLGNPAAGAPGWLMQGDLMKILEPGATVRGDTFVIRTCGQAFNQNGEVEATAYAEAVVQRFPEYIDPADDPTVNVWDPAANAASEDNKRFGRRFMMVSFRWLSKEEI